MYTVVNSRAYDPANLQTGLKNWQVASIVIDVVLGALVVLLEVLAVKGYRKAKAGEQVIAPVTGADPKPEEEETNK